MDETMQERLRDAGWRVKQAADGSLLLYPPDSSIAGVTPCPGIPAGTEIPLPVDTAEKARRIAEKWLESVPLDDATVGKIRNVVRVYMVSIVSPAPPYRLRNQIAIRKRDGTVVVVD
jgi:hypothetical protein